jgi:putative ABC transport system ATP-binding protein
MSDLLKLKKINLKYQTGKENISVLKNIDLTIKKKETVSVVGESGSGKTSLIMLVGGLEKPTSGKIIFQNQEITRLNEDEVSEIRKKNIGIIFQSFYLIPNYTAIENVALTLELNNFKNPENEAKILLDRFGLKHRFNNLTKSTVWWRTTKSCNCKSDRDETRINFSRRAYWKLRY